MSRANRKKIKNKLSDSSFEGNEVKWTDEVFMKSLSCTQLSLLRQSLLSAFV